MALVVKNLPASAGDARDVGSFPGSATCLGGGNGILAWRIPWTEELTVHRVTKELDTT